MAQSVTTVSSKLAGSIDLSQLHGVSHRQAWFLKQAERDVVRLLGPEALENIRDFGERCARDNQFVVAVTRHRSLFHPEVVSWLAKELADYLIAYHTMTHALGGAVESSFFGALPQTTNALVAMGKSLSRYSSNELRVMLGEYYLGDLGTAALLGGGEQPLWRVLSYGVIEQFNLLQRRAYLERLALQPAGDTSVSRRVADESAAYNDKFARLMTIATLSSLRRHSAQELLRYREIGNQQLNEHFVPFALEELVAQPVYYLASAEGGRVEVPRSLVETFGQIHHASWRVSREHIEGGARDSHSIQRHHKHISALDQERQELFYSNLSRISILTLPRELALLPDNVFEKILNVCRADSGSNGLIIAESKVSPESSLASEGLSSAHNNKQVSQHPQSRYARLVDREASRAALAFATRVGHGLMQDDFRLLQPLFSHIDATVERGELSRDLQSVTGALFEVARLRERMRIALTAEFLSSHWDKGKSVSGATEVDIEHLISFLPYETAQALQEMRTAQQQRVWELLALVPHTEETLIRPTHAVIEEITTLEDDVYFGMRRLIDQHRRRPSDPTFAELGGIVIDTYQREHIERYLADGNHMLVLRTLESHKNPFLHGFFLFGKVGVLPEEYKQEFGHILESMAIPLSQMSLSGLLALDRERPKAAYQRLYVRRLLITSLEGGEYSLGFVHENNAKHGLLVQAAGMRDLSKARVSLTDPITGEPHVYVPKLLDVNEYVVPGASREQATAKK